MKLKSIFKNPVDRYIEGVIKADDEACLRLEFEEYVLTNEVEKRLDAFLDAYNSYEGANGVWISGFFGSGKSHLLKILALLLENRVIDGVPVLDIFLPKCGDNTILKEDLKKAVRIPSKSILFNIDQKADVISKTQIDALLAVFVKVFDESCGYYGKQPYIAQFERELDRDGLLQKFKAEFQTIAGNDWDWGRQRTKRVSSFIDQAYNSITGQNITNVIDKYRTDYRLSIEDFADQVHAYIETQGQDFRLNFFVDEVGQYIADNKKLMTNLQTIAESFATKSRGRVWIIVTAQEEMTKVIGEMQENEDDFSKIQDRFKNRMKLQSTDVAEVIQKRLLSKDGPGINKLSDLYHDQCNNFKTLFDFADGSRSYKNFKDSEHFIDAYPFIPYQFALFQTAIKNLSQHNAFEGKHSSVGERSMLSVFQQVAIQICEYETGQLATFDMMFEGIRSSLKSNIQSSILLAEKHLDNKLAIRLLKALFLVKYIKEFKSTVRNLCILMYESFDQDIPQLCKNVEEALSILEQQTYIQRNGNYYEYLTDEEKDVEQEIKLTDVDDGQVAEELAKIVFDNVIKTRKIRFDENGQDYPFTRKLDDRAHGREYELTIHVITPFHEHFENEFVLQSQTMGRDELLVVLPPDDRIVRDLVMYKKTEKYVNQNLSTTQQETIQRILTDKRFQNQDRYQDLQKRVESLIGQSKLYINGSKLAMNGEAPQAKITRGFYELLKRTYSNLQMLKNSSYTENDIGNYLKYSQDGMFANDAVTFTEAEQEMVAFVQSNNRGGVRTSLKSLVDKFERKPYGWYYAAILCILAKLIARGKIEVRQDGTLLEENELEKALRNSHAHSNIILDPQIDFTASQVRRLKEFYADFFDSPPQASEAKALGKETGETFKEFINDLTPLASQAGQYPFLSSLKPAIDKLKEFTGKPYTWYLTELSNHEDTLFDLKEGTLDPIRKFMSGSQKDIYETASRFIQTQEPNFAYIEGEEASTIQEILLDATCYKGNQMQQAKSLVDSLKEKIDQQLDQEINTAKSKIEDLQNRMQQMDQFSKLEDNKKEEILKSFSSTLNTLERQTLIAVIRDTARRFEEEEYSRLLTSLSAWTKPLQEDKPNVQGVTANAQNGGTIAVQKRVEVVPARSLKVSFNKAWLEDETDVHNYLESTKEAMLKEIKDGKRIQI